MSCSNVIFCRTPLSGFLLIVLLAWLDPTSQLTADDGSGVLRAGAYAADITPTYFPVSSTPHRDHQISKVHDRLHARCIVLDNGLTRIAIVICDNNMIPREIFDAAKTKAAAATGIPAQNMLMAATHTHSAVTVAGIFQSKRETKYIPFLIEQIARGIETAASQLEPARVGWAVGRNPDQVFNRRWFMKPGFELKDPSRPGNRQSPHEPPAGIRRWIAPPARRILKSVSCRFNRPTAGPSRCWQITPCITSVTCPKDMLSADYFGEFARCIAHASVPRTSNRRSWGSCPTEPART